MFQRTQKWNYCFSYFRKCNAGPVVFVDVVKGLPINHKLVSFFLFLFKILLQSSNSALLSSSLYLASAFAPPAEVILHVKPSWQPAALQGSGCVQNPRQPGKNSKREGEKTARIPISLLVTPNLHSLPALPSWWIYKWIEKVLFQTCVGMLFARG